VSERETVEIDSIDLYPKVKVEQTCSRVYQATGTTSSPLKNSLTFSLSLSLSLEELIGNETDWIEIDWLEPFSLDNLAINHSFDYILYAVINLVEFIHSENWVVGGRQIAVQMNPVRGMTGT